MNQVSVIVPSFNEQEALPETLREAVDVLSKLNIEFELIVVDDGSRDKTAGIAETWARQDSRIKVFHHSKNLGLGAALKTGFSKAKFELLTSLPADGQIDPRDIGVFLQEIENADFVTTLRKTPYRSIYRRLLSWGLRGFVILLFGHVPPQKVGRMFRKKILEKVQISSNTAVANMELIIKAYHLGYRFKVVISEHRGRTKGQTKIAHLKGIIKIFKELWRLRFSNEFKKFLSING